MAHLLMPGWPVTACNRETVWQRMATTPDPQQATCKVCLQRWQRLQQSDTYAGEQIPKAQTEYWSSLNRIQRFSFCRRFTFTRNLTGFHWYQFSREQRRALLSVIVQDGQAAWYLGLPGTEPEPKQTDHLRALMRKQRAIIKRVHQGKQNPADLERVLALQSELARELFR